MSQIDKTWQYSDFTIYEFNKINSTNSKAFDYIKSGQAFNNQVILAHQQTLGRGRKDRVWKSPKGNLYASLILQKNLPVQNIWQLSFLGVMVLREVVAYLLQKQGLSFEEIANVLKIKWPNDLILDNKKLSGLLLESIVNNSFAEYIILGFGINIISHPQGTLFQATNLQEFGIFIDQKQFLRLFLNKFTQIYQNWLNFGFSSIIKYWRFNAYNFKKKITVKLDEKKIVGIYEDLDQEGNLLLKVNDEVLKISAADILA